MTLGVLNGCDGQIYFPTAPADIYTTDQVEGTATGQDYPEQEANNHFDQSTPVDIGDGGVADVRASLSSSADIDFYDLGPIHAGDRIIVDVTAGDSRDLVAALFDEDQNLLMVNDDRSFFAGDLNPLIDMVVRHDSIAGYVAIAASPGGQAAGDYAISFSKLPNQGVLSPSPQSVILDFDGGDNVRISNLAGVDIPPFDAGDISPKYNGQTNEMIDAIVKTVRSDFDGLNIEFYSSGDGMALPGTATRIFFGTYNPQLLGLADSVDEYNERQVEEAIIYTDTFSLFMPLDPSLSEMAQAIANVASHETGHLLGLNHTADSNGLMDITASANRLLKAQAFLRSPLHDTIFPAGHQNAPQLLFDALGGNSSFLTRPVPVLIPKAENAWRAWVPDIPVTKEMLCSCFCKPCRERHFKRRLRGLE
jgi:hypothetical protein